MSVAVEDRPTDKVREEVIDQLIMNYSHGEISLEAFERRLDEAMNTQCNKTLKALTEDLPLSVDSTYVEQKKRDLNFNYAPNETKDVDQLISVFGNSSRKGAWQVPRELRSFSFFGGTEIDFTEARFTHPEVRVKVFCLFSGDDIYVPENVNVVSQAFGIFGSVDNSAPANSSPNAPTIYIEGMAIFGGVDIKIRRTIKERFMDFANSMRGLFK